MNFCYGTLILLVLIAYAGDLGAQDFPSDHNFNDHYAGKALDRIAFPIGGIGAGMYCVEGTGAISHVSVRNRMDFFNEPYLYAAISVRGVENGAKVLEGPVPDWKKFGRPEAYRGHRGTNYGLPRFDEARFLARFPFAEISLSDEDVPLEVTLQAWSPFVPTNEDASSLPAGALEYRFVNTSTDSVYAQFSFHAEHFMDKRQARFPVEKRKIASCRNGFILEKDGDIDHPEWEGAFAFYVDDAAAIVNRSWYRGTHYDTQSLLWRSVADATAVLNDADTGFGDGASIYLDLALAPGESKTVRLNTLWYVPTTNLRHGEARNNPNALDAVPFHTPWYAEKFASIQELMTHWEGQKEDLKQRSEAFREAFYSSSLPPEVLEAVAANLTILKTPTLLRQADGRLWGYEGSADYWGSCHGSCTHVYNYAQAIPHLFPRLERSLRNTEFGESQNVSGRQAFRTNLPIREVSDDSAHFLPGRYSASDGQLGGIMQVYREWRISGDTEWLKSIWPAVAKSLGYCINTWDPRHKGYLEEPQHNTYDIEFWGPNSMQTSFYLGALRAATLMGRTLGEDVGLYERLFQSGKAFVESQLFNGEYFVQDIQTEGMGHLFKPIPTQEKGEAYRETVRAINAQGPKYQYGEGCLADGVLGDWIARVSGLGPILDEEKIASHLLAVFKYNHKKDLSDHANPQRPSYAVGKEGGLLLCTWPRGDKNILPFIYSNEVWTGIEYHVASHLIMNGQVDAGLEIIRTLRERYDGRVRNPFNEYECGHWYVRAQASYGLLQALTGVRYDGLEQTLYIDSRIGDSFRSFLSTDSGFGVVGLRDGKPFLQISHGDIPVKRVLVSGREFPLAQVK